MIHNIRWRIALPYIVLVILVLAALAAYLSEFVRGLYIADLQAQLSSEARLAADALAEPLGRGAPPDELDALAKEWARQLEARVTIIASDGRVLGDSHENWALMDNHLMRPEVQQALAQGLGTSTRFSHTVGYDMMYAAVPVVVRGQVAGIARVARPLRQVEIHIARLRQSILLAAAAASVLAGLLALLIAERTVRPIRRLTRDALRLAEGNLDASILPTTRDEIADLARAFNMMASQLKEKMTALSEEKVRLADVLEHMADGVMIADGEGRVQLINPSAASLLGAASDAVGRPLAQVLRHHRLIELWRESIASGAEMEGTVELYRQNALLRVVVTPFRERGTEGSLIMLQDLTHVRRLETVRRDFISNVSHELRTPLASLKALVETLRDSASDDPQAARRFLDRMDAELDALIQMVRELLDLSRIESGQAPLSFAPTSVEQILLPPVERLRPQAERANLSLSVQFPPDIPAVKADVEAMHQVLMNLLHNAIKFTPPGGEIVVEAQARGREVVVSVRDTGVGIAPDDLPRIFERFYKADRSRSGGGTGLGLAIAKHIVQAHGGRIWAESEQGKGSTFYFTLAVHDISDNTTLTGR
ncbi:MAG: phosphate regulon sensor histidine kinase PhoR [Anaerolineales bacterium]